MRPNEKGRKTRNYTIDLVKGLLVLFVLYLHTTTFLTLNIPRTPLTYFLRSLFSITVPLFFVISGYFFYKSKNKSKNINKLLILYMIYAAITCFFDQHNFSNFFLNTLDLTSFWGYLWFIEYLLVFQMITYIFYGNLKRFKIFYTLILITCFIVTIPNFDLFYHYFDNVYQIVFFLSGFLISKFNINYKEWMIIFIIPSMLLLPMLNDYIYSISTIYTTITTLLIFIGINAITLKNDPLKFLTRNSLFILFIQYFVVQIIVEYNFTLNIVLFMFLFFTFSVLAITYLKEKINICLNYLLEILKNKLYI